MAQVYAIAKAILTLFNLFGKAWELWEERELRKAEKHIETKKKAATVLNKKIEKEVAKDTPDDEAIKEMHRRLVAIGSNH